MNIPQFINQEGVSPTMAGWNSGVKQRDTLQNSAVARMLQEAQAQNTLGRLKMDQEEHPLKLEGLRADNEGKVIGNNRARGQVTDEENTRRQKAMDNFFTYLDKNPDDPEGAFVYSGVPRNGKFQQIAQASPEERNRVIKAWRDNVARPDREKEAHQSGLRMQENTHQAVLQGQNQAAGDLRTRETQRQLEQMRIDAGKYQKANTIKVGFRNELSMAKTAAQKMAVVNQYSAIVDHDPDLAELKPVLAELRKQLTLQWQAEVQARQNPTGVNVPQSAEQGRIVPNAPPQPYPGANQQVQPNFQGPQGGTTSSGIKYTITPQ